MIRTFKDMAKLKFYPHFISASTIKFIAFSPKLAQIIWSDNMFSELFAFLDLFSSVGYLLALFAWILTIERSHQAFERQSGQVLFVPSHWFMHAAWNLCWKLNKNAQIGFINAFTCAPVCGNPVSWRSLCELLFVKKPLRWMPTSFRTLHGKSTSCDPYHRKI